MIIKFGRTLLYIGKRGFSNKVTFRVFPQGFRDKELTLTAVEGENLMEVILDNKSFGSELEEFGLCGKELSC